MGTRPAYSVLNLQQVDRETTPAAEAGFGRIANISADLARYLQPGTSAYGAAKGAIEVLTRYLAK